MNKRLLISLALVQIFFLFLITDNLIFSNLTEKAQSYFWTLKVCEYFLFSVFVIGLTFLTTTICYLMGYIDRSKMPPSTSQLQQLLPRGKVL